jgi:serine/threonine-protein kinase
MRRHRLALAMAAALALVLTAGLVGTTWGFINARRQRDAAIDARNDAIAARQAESEARELEQETDKFLVEIFTSIDPQKARGRDVSVREILDQASRRIEAKPPEHHLVESHLRFTFSKAYHALGNSEEAQRQLRRCLELDRGTDIEARRRQANIHDMLGLTYSHMGQHDQAESHFRRSVELYPAVKGAVRTDELIGRAHLAFNMLSRDELDEADELLSDVVAEMNRLGPTVDFEARVDVISKLAELRTQQGKYHEAEKIFRELLAEARTRGDDHPFVLQTLVALGELLRLQGRPREGLELQREAANLAPEVLGPEHPDTMVIFNNLALNLDAVGELDEAEKVYVMMLPRMRSKLGENHHNSLLFASNYGLLLQKKQKLDEAEAIFRQTAPRMDEALGPDHHDTLLIRSNLAWLRAQRGDLVESEAIYREVVRRAQDALGPNHPVTPYLGMRLGQVLSMAGKWAEAEPYLADADAFARAQGVPTRRAIAATAYGVCLANLKKSELALAKLLEANGLLGSLPQTDPKTVQTIASALAMTYEQMGNQDEAQKWRQASTSRPASGPTTRN